MLQNALGGIFGNIIVDGIININDELKLIKRNQNNWTCREVHNALYGINNEKTSLIHLYQISSIEYLEGPRYKDIALKRYNEKRMNKVSKQRKDKWYNIFAAGE